MDTNEKREKIKQIINHLLEISKISEEIAVASAETGQIDTSAAIMAMFPYVFMMLTQKQDFEKLAELRDYLVNLTVESGVIENLVNGKNIVTGSTTLQ